LDSTALGPRTDVPTGVAASYESSSFPRYKTEVDRQIKLNAIRALSKSSLQASINICKL
jgi:hypothetical protein